MDTYTNSSNLRPERLRQFVAGLYHRFLTASLRSGRWGYGSCSTAWGWRIEANVSLAAGRFPDGDRPSVQAIIRRDGMDEPATEGENIMVSMDRRFE